MLVASTSILSQFQFQFQFQFHLHPKNVYKAIHRRAMEITALSVGKSVLDGVLGYAKSARAEEVALQLGIQRDHAFIRDELEMMQAFLMAAHEEREEHKVVKTWVKWPTTLRTASRILAFVWRNHPGGYSLARCLSGAVWPSK